MGSSFSNHDAKGWKGQTEKKSKKEKQRKPKGRLHRTRLEQKYRKAQSK